MPANQGLADARPNSASPTKGMGMNRSRSGSRGGSRSGSRGASARGDRSTREHMLYTKPLNRDKLIQGIVQNNVKDVSNWDDEEAPPLQSYRS